MLVGRLRASYALLRGFPWDNRTGWQQAAELVPGRKDGFVVVWGFAALQPIHYPRVIDPLAAASCFCASQSGAPSFAEPPPSRTLRGYVLWGTQYKVVRITHLVLTLPYDIIAPAEEGQKHASMN